MPPGIQGKKSHTGDKISKGFFFSVQYSINGGDQKSYRCPRVIGKDGFGRPKKFRGVNEIWFSPKYLTQFIFAAEAIGKESVAEMPGEGWGEMTKCQYF